MKEQVADAMKAAMKAGDKVRTSVLRMLLADIKNAELAGQEAMDAVVAFGRRIEKSIEEYRRLGKDDEVAKLEAEHAVASEFLPAKLSEADLEAAVDKAIADENLASMKDFGRGMKAVMGALGPAADGKRVQAILKAKLGAG